MRKKTLQREDSIVEQPEIVSLIKESNTKGVAMRKLDNGKAQVHELVLDPTATQLVSQKGGVVIDIANIREIRLGFASQEFLSSGEGLAQEDQAFSIVYAEGKGPHAILNLVADSGHTRNWWNKTLLQLMKRINGKEGEVFAILKPWLSNLLDGKNTMSWKTAMNTLESMGMKTSAERAKSLLAEFDKDSNGRLDFGEFLQVLRRLRSHKSLVELYQKYTTKPEQGMTAKDLMVLFEKEQDQKLSLATATAFVLSVSSDNTTLDSDEFELLMIGKDNEAFDPESETTTHDMKLPLNRYFISSDSFVCALFLLC
jgi:Ca2+-binding EF-hand superfamily protein